MIQEQQFINVKEMTYQFWLYSKSECMLTKARPFSSLTTIFFLLEVLQQIGNPFNSLIYAGYETFQTQYKTF